MRKLASSAAVFTAATKGGRNGGRDDHEFGDVSYTNKKGIKINSHKAGYWAQSDMVCFPLTGDFQRRG